MNKVIGFAFIAVFMLLVGCAGERQGLVCEEIEYRLNTMTYSPDQRAYMENELRTCREDESKKKNESGPTGGSIYDRYANTESATTGDSSKVEIPVSTLLQDSSEEKTMSIYDRYKSVEADK
ncbi:MULTISPECIES: hypothetical protein [unclassified Fibrobacter]|jgi:hypothetical protein|uniref:hypothetical protein n=1 Tax=unclassified Fibrobacter TaxID=2634177 RepID=UPI00091515EE|nr:MULTISPECIES: hypothetical protein [unclassified Fibrobacter]SHM87827.1 hypothetical protein SAMN05720467_2597 [Fibrobacter sp. UWB7]SMG41184.1 hypothetical protein SAMN05720489_2872 [Fibrobacter sp. UWB13]